MNQGKKVHEVAIHLSTFHQLLHSKDFVQQRLSNRTLNPDFAQYILEEVDDSDLSGHFAIKLILDNIVEVNSKTEQSIATIIRRFFLYEAIQQRKKLKDIFKMGFIGLFIGVIVNFICLLFYFYLNFYL